MTPEESLEIIRINSIGTGGRPMSLPLDLIDSPTAESERVNPVGESNFCDRAVSKYFPKGTARGGFSYFRFSYKEGSRTLTVHIPGGNVRSPLAQARAALVRDAVREGKSNLEIVGIIQKW